MRLFPLALLAACGGVTPAPEVSMELRYGNLSLLQITADGNLRGPSESDAHAPARLELMLHRNVLGRYVEHTPYSTGIPEAEPYGSPCPGRTGLREFVDMLARLNRTSAPQVQMPTSCTVAETFACLTDHMGQQAWKTLRAAARSGLPVAELVEILKSCAHAPARWDLEPYVAVSDKSLVFHPGSVGQLLVFEGDWADEPYSRLIVNLDPVARLAGGTCKEHCFTSPLPLERLKVRLVPSRTYTAVLMPNQDDQRDDAVFVLPFRIP